MAKCKVSVRWMMPRDLDAVVLIDAQGHRPWSRKRLCDAARYDGKVVLVAETAREGVVGFLVYSPPARKKRATLLRLAVAESARLTGVGRALLGDFEAKMASLEPPPAKLAAEVPDDDLDAHRFLKACGWAAVKVRPEKSAYEFAKSLEEVLTGA